ncbi:MAG TPA: DUF4387 family protein [Frankiaceae bacterium]|jgi:hypothetical protein|nr:DUF4387 family protein [Frankiaceae bacterium]
MTPALTPAVTTPLPAATSEGLEHIRRNFRLIRSKDAGPFMLTLDLFFADAEVHEAFRSSGVLAAAVIAQLYGVAADEVDSYDMAEIAAMKLSFPRKVVSGDFGDTDITGGQQYAVLIEYLAALEYGSDGRPT